MLGIGDRASINAITHAFQPPRPVGPPGTGKTMEDVTGIVFQRPPAALSIVAITASMAWSSALPRTSLARMIPSASIT